MEDERMASKATTTNATKPTVWKNPNGTFSHHKDAQREWADETACRTDLRFHNEWSA